ncbi:ATP-binding cassette domain-containing protein [Streptomyces sp. NBC_00984]|uniref:ATP-binding cassette domain-containing protein n=1 Tax=Streptomyces sp. NBC_00984 TaxID=2903700 RepID=UPI0038699ABF|nr:ATP-binding cassette domain-containing protein [Streptomyces sp. NBC_00984]
MNTVVPPQDWDLLAQLAAPGSTATRRIDGRHTVYLVEGGPADIFASRLVPDGDTSRQHFVARCPAHSAIPSSTATGEWQLTVVPLAGGRLRGVDHDQLSRLCRQVQPEESDGCRPPGRDDRIADVISDALDRALQAVSDAVRSTSAPRDAQVLRSRQIVSLTRGRTVVGSGRPCWIRLADGRMSKNGLAGREALFLGLQDWTRAESDCLVELLNTPDLLRSGALFEAVDQQMAHLVRSLGDRALAADTVFLHALDVRKRAAEQMVAASARRALGVLGANRARGGRLATDGAQDARAWAVETLQVVTEGADVTVTEPPTHTPGTSNPGDELRAVAQSSGLHLRQVRLSTKWWHNNVGPLIGWRPTQAVGSASADQPTDTPTGGPAVSAGTEGDARLIPVPLLFARGRYWMVNPHTRARTPVDQRRAQTFSRNATLAQLPLPAHSSLRQLLRRGAFGTASELRSMLANGVAVASLSLATPLLIGQVLSSLTSGGLQDLPWATGLYLVSAVAAALFTALLNLHALRLEDRLESGVQLALWDRLIRLPSDFFTQTTSGVLASKMLGTAYARQALNGLATRTFLALLTAAAGLALTLKINPVVGLYTLVLLAGTSGLGVLFGAAMIRRQRQALPAEHHAAAVTNEIFGGIMKIRLAGAENAMFSRWAQATVAARARLQRVHRVQGALSAVAVTVPIAGQLILFAVLAGPLRGQVPASGFFTLNAAFALQLQSMILLVTSGAEFVVVLPRLHGLSEVLTARAEREPSHVQPVDLRGEIEIVNATFGYPGQDTPVLDKVTLHAHPGQFIAIVGTSGSGKSTLLRLLLGFERPRSGSVLYDGQDLAELDVQTVRRQCGVVLQDGRLFSGTIRENICGAQPYSVEQVWEAAAMAGLDEDIHRMPMGLNSLLSFGGGALSVGQRQRVLIARALISKPRVLFFDEATSALDNHTQEIVTASTQQLAATRIVIAHRLSTVINADVILVMDQGRIVQSGTYHELLADTGGLFHRLAQRQLWAQSANPRDAAAISPTP